MNLMQSLALLASKVKSFVLLGLNQEFIQFVSELQQGHAAATVDEFGPINTQQGINFQRRLYLLSKAQYGPIPIMAMSSSVLATVYHPTRFGLMKFHQPLAQIAQGDRLLEGCRV